ncbi:MAG: hypothetical protein VX798_05980 [Bacteroidota bacterium]|nr:hypothetical protein [Bacteroidota bacterium]
MKATIQFNLTDKGGGKERTKQEKKQPSFTIKIKELKEALDGSYMGLGTPYSPIKADNFIDLENEEYASIYGNTKITAHLVSKDLSNKIKDIQLVCCKIINIDREHNKGLKGSPGNPWNGIFRLKGNKFAYAAPDGTLYIAPNEKGECTLITEKNVPNVMLAYSMIFSITVALELDHGVFDKSFYFVLDPVVKVNSGHG